MKNIIITTALTSVLAFTPIETFNFAPVGTRTNAITTGLNIFIEQNEKEHKQINDKLDKILKQMEPQNQKEIKELEEKLKALKEDK